MYFSNNKYFQNKTSCKKNSPMMLRNSCNPYIQIPHVALHYTHAHNETQRKFLPFAKLKSTKNYLKTLKSSLKCTQFHFFYTKT